MNFGTAENANYNNYLNGSPGSPTSVPPTTSPTSPTTTSPTSPPTAAVSRDTLYKPRNDSQAVIRRRHMTTSLSAQAPAVSSPPTASRRTIRRYFYSSAVAQVPERPAEHTSLHGRRGLTCVSCVGARKRPHQLVVHQIRHSGSIWCVESARSFGLTYRFLLQSLCSRIATRSGGAKA